MAISEKKSYVKDLQKIQLDYETERPFNRGIDLEKPRVRPFRRTITI